MPVSGLNITITDKPHITSKLLENISRDPSFEIGLHEGNHLAVVLETNDAQQDKHKHRWLSQLPGVIHIDVVFIYFDEHGEYLSDSIGTCENMA
ncbi:hypothetical protein JD969_10730 [Planctomycetota bacterium]|nr:hypothetical protein JD969_10730 [Planctomycetota bacterium]